MIVFSGAKRCGIIDMCTRIILGLVLWSMTFQTYNLLVLGACISRLGDFMGRETIDGGSQNNPQARRCIRTDMHRDLRFAICRDPL